MRWSGEKVCVASEAQIAKRGNSAIKTKSAAEKQPPARTVKQVSPAEWGS